MQCLLHTFLLSVCNSVICLKVIGVLIHQGMFLFIFILILIIVIILYLFRCEDEISFLIFVHVQFHWAGFQKEVDPTENGPTTSYTYGIRAETGVSVMYCNCSHVCPHLIYYLLSFFLH